MKALYQAMISLVLAGAIAGCGGGFACDPNLETCRGDVEDASADAVELTADADVTPPVDAAADAPDASSPEELKDAQEASANEEASSEEDAGEEDAGTVGKDDAGEDAAAVIDAEPTDGSPSADAAQDAVIQDGEAEDADSSLEAGVTADAAEQPDAADDASEDATPDASQDAPEDVSTDAGTDAVPPPDASSDANPVDAAPDAQATDAEADASTPDASQDATEVDATTSDAATDVFEDVADAEADATEDAGPSCLTTGIRVSYVSAAGATVVGVNGRLSGSGSLSDLCGTDADLDPLAATFTCCLRTDVVQASWSATMLMNFRLSGDTFSCMEHTCGALSQYRVWVNGKEVTQAFGIVGVANDPNYAVSVYINGNSYQ